MHDPGPDSLAASSVTRFRADAERLAGGTITRLGLAVSGGAEYLKRVVVPLLPRKLRYAPGSRAAA